MHWLILPVQVPVAKFCCVLCWVPNDVQCCFVVCVAGQTGRGPVPGPREPLTELPATGATGRSRAHSDTGVPTTTRFSTSEQPWAELLLECAESVYTAPSLCGAAKLSVAVKQALVCAPVSGLWEYAPSVLRCTDGATLPTILCTGKRFNVVLLDFGHVVPCPARCLFGKIVPLRRNAFATSAARACDDLRRRDSREPSTDGRMLHTRLLSAGTRCAT
jgi:hypothetical protein